MVSDSQPSGEEGRRDGRPAHGPPIPSQRDSRYSLSLEYGLAMLQCFTADEPRQGIADLADILGVSRATAHRYAITLRKLGHLEQDKHHKYRLTSTVQDTGAAVIGRLRRKLPALDVLERLRRQTGYTVSMAALDDTAAIYCHRLHAHGKGQYDADSDIGIGVRLPLHSTALGKALLAHIPVERCAYLILHIDLRGFTSNTVTTEALLIDVIEKCRLDGIAVSDREHLPGARSIAVSVADCHGIPPMAVEVTAPATACTMQELLARAGPVLQSAVEEISVRQSR